MHSTASDSYIRAHGSELVIKARQKAVRSALRTGAERARPKFPINQSRGIKAPFIIGVRLINGEKKLYVRCVYYQASRAYISDQED
jgi:hypothetical protein